MTITPLDFQKKAIVKIEKWQGRALLAADMGLGKTLMSAWTLIRDRIDSWPVVVVCPASVKYNWESVIGSLGTMPMVAEGRKPPSTNNKGFLQYPRILIINYDIVSWWVDFIKELDPSTMIIDESQMIKNRDSKRSKAVKELSLSTKNIIALSGTPLVNRPEELWNTLNTIRPDLYPSFFQFAHRYCKPTITQYGSWDYSGAENMDELHQNLIDTMMIRIRKKDVMKDMPEKIRTILPVYVENEREYKKASRDFMGWMKTRHAAKAGSAAKAEHLVKIGYLLRLAAKLKLKPVVDWCADFLQNTEEKLVIFAVHQKMIEALDRRIPGKHVIINGGVTGRQRQANLYQFIHDPETRVIIGNIKAMGTGIDGLQKVASTSVIAELPWQPGELSQLEDRTHRMGQNHPTWYYYILAKNTIEEKMCEVLQRKQSIISEVLDGGEQQEDLKLLDELVKALNEQAKGS